MGSPKGHRNLAIRGGIALCHGFLSLIMVVFDLGVPYTLPTAVCQFASAATLFTQWWTANPLMFVARALPSFIRCILAGYVAACGRGGWPGENCASDAWSDIRLPLRLTMCCASVRFFFNGLSLMLQFLFPQRGVGVRGNEQLFYRGFVRALGLPINFTSGMLKLGELAGTPYERQHVEVMINFIRCFILAPAATWSLWNQWVSTGTGRRTDDYRTSFVGEEKEDTLNTMADYIDSHRGHRNLLIRSALSFGQGVLSVCLVANAIDTPHKLPLAICQFVSALALIVQWYTDDRSMYLLRACGSWIRCGLLIHLSYCGRFSPGEQCAMEGWSDIRRPFRGLHILAAARMFFNGTSLAMQAWRPDHGVTAMYGCDQLFYRACIQAVGIPIYLARALAKVSNLAGTEYERSGVEIAVDLLRACYFIPIRSWSLYEQWLHSGDPDVAKVNQEQDQSLDEEPDSDDDDSSNEI